jgi:hypothetical protein
LIISFPPRHGAAVAFCERVHVPATCPLITAGLKLILVAGSLGPRSAMIAATRDAP